MINNRSRKDRQHREIVYQSGVVFPATPTGKIMIDAARNLLGQ
jgi:hypothetical protein